MVPLPSTPSLLPLQGSSVSLTFIAPDSSPGIISKWWWFFSTFTENVLLLTTPNRISKCFDQGSGYRPYESRGVSCPHLSLESHNKQMPPRKCWGWWSSDYPSGPIIYGKLTFTHIHTNTLVERRFLTHKAFSWPMKTQYSLGWSVRAFPRQ